MFLLANNYLPGRSSMVSEAAVLQMAKNLNLTIVLAVGCILVGCARHNLWYRNPWLLSKPRTRTLAACPMSARPLTRGSKKADAGTRSANIYPAIMS
jgi:hypothetical protein